MNKFKIITPSFNNEHWVEYYAASILNQTYTNYEVLYIDDNSTDNTLQKIKNIVGNLPNWHIIHNDENKGATYNYFEYLNDYATDDNDIIIHLDGDDWLYDNDVLDKLNTFYIENDSWMTYGGFICWNGNEPPSLPHPQSTPYPEFIHEHKLYRRDLWRASHLRTYRYFLIKTINKEDLKSIIDGKYYWHASDLAFQYPCLEMCPKNKIGVIDFYAHVYNHSKQNQSRTHERENADNSKYEIEIRNRKQYIEGLSGDKLPLINAFADYQEYNQIPTKFSYCYMQENGEFDMVLLCDTYILDYVGGKIKINKNVPIVARLYEQREYFGNQIFNAVLQNSDKFTAILTYDKELLGKLPNAVFMPVTEVTQFNMLPNPNGYAPYKSPMFSTYELPDAAFQIYQKTKLVSAISSAKAFLPGHVTRLEFINSIKDKVDLFGRGINEIPSKLDGLAEYAFSVAIENVYTDDYYFSEKIVDCFLTGTVPIYYGCPNIHKFFNMDGILTFTSIAELHNILDSISLEKYQSMLPAIKMNFDKCFEYTLNNDMIYDKFFKKIIEDGTII